MSSEEEGRKEDAIYLSIFLSMHDVFLFFEISTMNMADDHRVHCQRSDQSTMTSAYHRLLSWNSSSDMGQGKQNIRVLLDIVDGTAHLLRPKTTMKKTNKKSFVDRFIQAIFVDRH